MLLFWYECKKLLQLPVMIVAVIACILLNLLVCYIYKENEWVNFQAEDTASNIFIDYDTSEDAERVIYDYEISEKYAENIRNKYEKLQAVVDEKAENGDSLSHYFGDSTSYRHHVLFGTIFGFLIAECAILMMFAALLSTNYENARNTELFVYATRSGRKIMRIKLLAGLAVGLAVSAVIFTATLANTISTFDFLSVWNDNVSSSFNMLYTDGSPY
ncbi:MAG: hypothetical protein LBM93_15370, partial [Oscillospiraceae bacterium]|nr:hypothetical protein [Oscillospiraceae bacterium]